MMTACGSACQAQRTVAMPVSPKDLLASLPGKEPAWQMTLSRAEHLSDRWPMAQASRQFTWIVQGATEPVTLRMTILDAGSNPTVLSTFTPPPDAEAAREAAMAERLNLGGAPAIRYVYPGESSRVVALLLQRFVVTVVLTGPTQEKADGWIEKINLSALRTALAAQQRTVDISKDYSFLSERVDEVDPKRNRSKVMHIAVISPE